MNGNGSKIEAAFCTLIRAVCKNVETIKDKASGSIAGVFNQTAAELGFTEINSCKLENQQNCGAYEEAGELLETLLFEVDIKQSFKSSLLAVSKKREELLRSIQNLSLFPEKKIIYEYLEQYYALLVKVVREVCELKDSGKQGRKFLQELLNVDMVFGEPGDFVPIYNPAALNGLLRLYECIEEYQRSIQGIRNGEMKRQYREIVVYKALRFFRWIVVRDGVLMQAAIPSGELKEKEIALGLGHKLIVPIRPLSEYNSYEGIGELRLLDKVLYEIERRTANNEILNGDFKITIFGDIQWRPMQELCQVIEYALKTEYREKLSGGMHIQFEVYTYNTDEAGKEDTEGPEDDSNIWVSYRFHEYRSEILRWKKLDKILKESRITFLLDSCDLYSEIEVEEVDGKSVWQQAEDDFYQKLYTGINSLEYVMQNLCVFSCFGKTGSLKKNLNRSLLNHLREQVSDYNTIYLYVSDLRAFRMVTYNELNLMRIERYNEKEIAILILSSLKEEGLKTGEDTAEKIIVLSLWQMIKYITVNNIEEFLQAAGLNSLTDILTIRNTLIGIDYRNWPEKLSFYYQLPLDTKLPERYEEYLKTCIIDEVMPFFKSNLAEKDAFYEYYVKSYSSPLYSDAKDVDDMLFLHLFKNKHHLLKETELKGKREDLTNFRPRIFIYSSKQYYQEIMEDYDTSSEEFAFKYIKLERLRKVDPQLRKVIFDNIRRSCERNDYKDSYLYIKFNER